MFLQKKQELALTKGYSVAINHYKLRKISAFHLTNRGIASEDVANLPPHR